jgi:Asp-tRNA(Asn)/Glu-tRNA(Gln) amidotransferase A subunit family amidase
LNAGDITLDRVRQFRAAASHRRHLGSRVWTLLGPPAVALPGLRGPQGLPLGVQLIGHPQREHALLGVAAVVHQVIADTDIEFSTRTSSKCRS